MCLRCSAEYDSPRSLCAACYHMDTVFEAPARRRAAIDAQFESSTAKALVASSWTVLDVSDALPGVRIAPRSLVLLTGAPGAGKSTLALQLANCSARPVVLFAAEERLGQSVGDRLSRLGIRREDFHVVGRGSVDELVAFCRRVHAAVLVVDSVSASTLLAHDLRAIVNQLTLDMLVGTVQVVKDGTMRGPRELAHECDLLVEVEGGRWRVLKSRYSATGAEGEVSYVAC